MPKLLTCNWSSETYLFVLLFGFHKNTELKFSVLVIFVLTSRDAKYWSPSLLAFGWPVLFILLKHSFLSSWRMVSRIVIFQANCCELLQIKKSSHWKYCDKLGAHFVKCFFISICMNFCNNCIFLICKSTLTQVSKNKYVHLTYFFIKRAFILANENKQCGKVLVCVFF